MDALQMAAAQRKVSRHYGLNRKVTEAEVYAEVEMLKRQGPLYWDDVKFSLASMLQTGSHPIVLVEEESR